MVAACGKVDNLCTRALECARKEIESGNGLAVTRFNLDETYLVRVEQLKQLGQEFLDDLNLNLNCGIFAFEAIDCILFERQLFIFSNMDENIDGDNVDDDDEWKNLKKHMKQIHAQFASMPHAH